MIEENKTHHQVLLVPPKTPWEYIVQGWQGKIIFMGDHLSHDKAEVLQQQRPGQVSLLIGTKDSGSLQRVAVDLRGPGNRIIRVTHAGIGIKWRLMNRLVFWSANDLQELLGTKEGTKIVRQRIGPVWADYFRDLDPWNDNFRERPGDPYQVFCHSGNWKVGTMGIGPNHACLNNGTAWILNTETLKITKYNEE